MTNVVQSIYNKQKQFEKMQNEMSMATNRLLNSDNKLIETIDPINVKNDNYNIQRGDCVQLIKGVESDSVHYSIFSPPFASLYTYSDHLEDMGNSKDYDDFFIHFQFLIKELYRVIKPGRLVSIHCMNLPTSKTNHGYIGIQDFRGDIIRWFQKEGFIYHSEVCIWKDPVIEMQRTKAHGLLYKQLRKDSSYSRVGMPEYLLLFRKWGEDKKPVNWKTKENFPLDKWQEYASPLWQSIPSEEDFKFHAWNDIVQTNVLNKELAREGKDEKHICPLQLDVIEKAVEMWTNPGDTVFTPFMGIGSECYQALKMGRKAVGIELKESYFNIAKRNLDGICDQHKLL
jgi:DNA modification methylase